jgi:hypothetical protein
MGIKITLICEAFYLFLNEIFCIFFCFKLLLEDYDVYLL